MKKEVKYAIGFIFFALAISLICFGGKRFLADDIEQEYVSTGITVDNLEPENDMPDNSEPENVMPDNTDTDNDMPDNSETDNDNIMTDNSETGTENVITDNHETDNKNVRSDIDNINDVTDKMETENDSQDNLEPENVMPDALETEISEAPVFRNKKLLDQHYEKHGIEMGFDSAKAYEAAAGQVVVNPNALHKIEKEDGDDVYYLEDTNEFVVVSTDGYIRTYFLPDKGKAYFDKQ